MNERRVALVTGSGSLIGRAIIDRLSRDGIDVVATDLGVSDGGGDQSVAVQHIDADLLEPDAPGTLIDNVVERCGRLDILVNNAGVNRNGPIDAHRREDFDRIFAVNVRAPFELMRASVQALHATRGVVINIASLASFVFTGEHLAYSASKWAVVGLTREAAVELGRLGIRVVAVAPGPTRSGMWENVASERTEQLTAATPIGDVNDPDDVAAAVSFLASEGARHVTGAILPVTGGAELAIVPASSPHQ